MNHISHEPEIRHRRCEGSVSTGLAGGQALQGHPIKMNSVAPEAWLRHVLKHIADYPVTGAMISCLRTAAYKQSSEITPLCGDVVSSSFKSPFTQNVSEQTLTPMVPLPEYQLMHTACPTLLPILRLSGCLPGQINQRTASCPSRSPRTGLTNLLRFLMC